MNFRNFASQLIAYNPEKTYNFFIGNKMASTDLSQIDDQQDQFENKLKSSNVSNNIQQNKRIIQSIYNTLINSDIMLRQFTLNTNSEQYEAFLLYIDGMIDVKSVNDFVLESLMLNGYGNVLTKELIKNQDLSDFIYNLLLPENSVTKCLTFGEIVSGVNSGNCALFVDTINVAYNIDVKGFQQRSINSPNNEVIIKGPQEAFVENIRTNTSQLRRIMNNENLIIENIAVGNISKTNCAVCYMQNITNNNLVAEVKYRINNLSIDTLLSSGQLEQLIEDNSQFGIPQILSTERPDKCTKHLMQGRVVVLVNGSPYGLIMPATIIDYMGSPEDTNIKPQFANFLKLLRFIALFVTLLLPRHLCSNYKLSSRDFAHRTSIFNTCSQAICPLPHYC